jgi:transcriptional regulator of NAD metabolism
LQINAALKGLQAIFPEEIVVETLEFETREEYLSWLENNKTVSSEVLPHRFTLFSKLELLNTRAVPSFGSSLVWSSVAMLKP